MSEDKEHGIPSKVIMKDVLDVLEVFKKHGVQALLSYGAVLGAVRNKDFIPWDDDIDLDVVQPIDLRTRKSIGWMLYDLGFMPQPISMNVFGRMEPLEYGYNGDGETGIIVCERNFKFSIFFYKQEGDLMVCRAKLGAGILISNQAKFYEKLDEVKLHGHKFATPGPLKGYLAHVYGKDWKTPIKDLHAPNCITGKPKHE
jgi:LicD family